MADSQVSGLVEQVKVGSTTHNLASTAYGICDTAAGTAAKIVNMTGFYLTKGVTVHIKFTDANSAASPTLNINDTGAIPIVLYGTSAAGTTSATSGWQAGAVVSLTYDGTSWVRDQGYNTNSTYTITSVWCNTAAGTAAKTFSNASYYTANDKSYFEITFRYTNTAQSALTLNDKALYINGKATSSSNYTLPAGKYLVYYENEIYYIRTDGKITGDITGDAATVNGLTVQTAVPPNAVFTDKYHKSGSWSGLTYTATAVNNAEELQFTIPDNYGDTKNPYSAKGKNLILAGPSSGSNAAPSFRALVAADIPDLSETYLPLNGSKEMSGQIKLGSSTQSSAPNNSGIYIHDTRSVSHLPTTWGNKTVQWYFDSGAADTGRTGHATIMHLKGWTDSGSTTYAAHQLSFNATSNTNDGNLYHRTGLATTWQAWRKILDSENYTDYTVTKTGSGASGNWDISVTGSSASCTGNAATATVIQTAGTTAQFYRGDNSWSNILKQTAAAALGIDANSKIGTAIKDLHFSLGSGSGTASDSGNAGGITFGTDSASYGGIYWQTSGSYGSRIHFATTGSFANGAYTRMIITHDGKVGIGTLSPDTLLTVNGNAKATKFIGTLEGNADSATTATKTGLATIWLYPENNNEINFGGTNTGTTIYFGYRAKDSRAIPTKFIFGSSTGTADLQAKTIYLGSGTTSYVSSTQYTGNAATASKISAKLATTTKTYLLGTSTAITGTAANVEMTGDTGVYLTTTAGQLNATTYLVNEKVRMEYNSTDQSLDFIFI